jgi:peptide deformylase
MNSAGQLGEGTEQVVINPVVSRARGNEEAEEGCLSLPNIHGNVIRAKSIHLNGFDLQGQEIDVDLTGYEARIVLHENDHLDGTLFIDRLREGSISDIEMELDALETDFRSRQRTLSIPSDEELVARLLNWEQRFC